MPPISPRISISSKYAACKLVEQFSFNPLTPISDQDRISPYIINTLSTREVMRIKKNIDLGLISWFDTKFSELTL